MCELDQFEFKSLDCGCITVNCILIVFNWTVFKCLEMKFVVIRSFMNKTELNLIESGLLLLQWLRD